MQLTFLRGACVIIEANNYRILCDPWLEDGCYYGAWAHFPPFPQSDYRVYGLDNIDLIYVSHIHPDHFDVATMRQFKRKPPVVIAKYPVPFLKHQIEQLGHEVIEIPHGNSFLCGGVAISIYLADDCDPKACGVFYGCSMPSVLNTQIDSMAVITDGKRTIVNVNDCPWGLSGNLCRRIAKDHHVDLAMIAFAGAGPYPQCFKMPQDKIITEAKRKRLEFVGGVINFARALRARRVFPFAGDYQLCGRLSCLNEVRGVPEVADVYRKLWEEGIDTLALNPGQTADIDEPGFPIQDHSFLRKRYVTETLAGRKLDYEDDGEPNLGQDLFDAAFDRFDAKRKEHGLLAKATAYFKIGERLWYKVPPEGGHGWTKVPPAGHYVEISTNLRMLERLLKGPKHAHWNNAQIGSHIRFDRQPAGLYEPGLYHLLSYFHA